MAVVGSLLLAALAGPVAFANPGLDLDARYSSGQLSIRLVIPEPLAISRDQQGRPCLLRDPRQSPVAIEPEPRVPIAGCDTAARTETVFAQSGGVQTFLVTPL